MKGNTKFKKYLGIVAAVLLLGVIYPLLNGAGDASGNNGTEQAGQDFGADEPDRAGQDSTENLYTFRNERYLTEHFEKHGSEFDYASKEEYEAGANRVIAAEGALHKTEAEDGDHIYYLESSNEIVFLSTDGYIRTYFKPQDGIEYYERQ